MLRRQWEEGRGDRPCGTVWILRLCWERELGTQHAGPPSLWARQPRDWKPAKGLAGLTKQFSLWKSPSLSRGPLGWIV